VEVFGLDIMIDEDLGLWLIEVNRNPCLEESNSYLAQLIPRMIDDFFKLTIDKILIDNEEFDRRYRSSTTSAPETNQSPGNEADQEKVVLIKPSKSPLKDEFKQDPTSPNRF
jgi:hypothetical protein